MRKSEDSLICNEHISYPPPCDWLSTFRHDLWLALLCQMRHAHYQLELPYCPAHIPSHPEELRPRMEPVGHVSLLGHLEASDESEVNMTSSNNIEGV